MSEEVDFIFQHMSPFLEHRDHCRSKATHQLIVQTLIIQMHLRQVRYVVRPRETLWFVIKSLCYHLNFCSKKYLFYQSNLHYIKYVPLISRLAGFRSSLLTSRNTLDTNSGLQNESPVHGLIVHPRPPSYTNFSLFSAILLHMHC